MFRFFYLYIYQVNLLVSHFSACANRYADAYRNEMVAFVECAHEKSPTPVGVEDGRAAYLIGKAAKTSMETGQVREIRRSERFSNGGRVVARAVVLSLYEGEDSTLIFVMMYLFALLLSPLVCGVFPTPPFLTF